MRLLDASTLQLCDFPSDSIPEYAILSHRWESEGEVLFADIGSDRAKEKAGYEKIQQICALAMLRGLGFVWIDTCCINKESSAELSEAINSMYAWYQGASVCYAYLSDVPAMGEEDLSEQLSSFAQSKWFQRGWTLQELIAPSDLIILSCDWESMGTKSSLRDVIARVTGINPEILTGQVDFRSCSLAKRMSWASDRVTTRVEDVAYCLMGMFDVNMPLLYGEGIKAFRRLQEEIIKYSDDESLFAWTSTNAAVDSHHGLLAQSPSDFKHSGEIICYVDWEASEPYSVSNKGLRMHLYLNPVGNDVFTAALRCPSPDQEAYLGIYLKRLSAGLNQFSRARPSKLVRISERGSLQTVNVRNFVTNDETQNVYPKHVFQLRSWPEEDKNGYTLAEILSPPGLEAPTQLPMSQKSLSRSGQQVRSLLIRKEARSLAGALLFERNDGARVLIKLGSKSALEIGFDVTGDLQKPLKSFKRLEQSFRPRLAGENMVLKDHQVRINAVVRIDQSVKFYMLDFVIEAIYHGSDPMQVINNLLPGLSLPVDERPAGAVVKPTGFAKLNQV